MTEETIYKIPLSDISVSARNARQTDCDKELDDLAASIQKLGLIHPVELLGEYGRRPYKLIVGQRRYLAHKKLGKKTIRAVFAGGLTDVQAEIRSLAENMHRVELNHADALEAVTKLYKHFGRDERRVAAETGMSLRRVRQYIDIHELASDKTKEKLRAGKVSPADVHRTLQAAAGDKDKADRILRIIEKERLDKYVKKRIVEYGTAHPKAAAEEIVEEAQTPRVEQSISVRLLAPVRKGLERAAKEMAMDPEEVASQALAEWLSAKGFCA